MAVQEDANIGRHFRIGKEGEYDFYLRGEFVNIFNRTQMPNPIAPNPQNAPSKNNLGIYTAGFGVIPADQLPNTAHSQIPPVSARSTSRAVPAR